MRFLLVAALGLSGCGITPINSRLYDVHTTVVTDTSPGLNREGLETAAFWRITPDADDCYLWVVYTNDYRHCTLDKDSGVYRLAFDAGGASEGYEMQLEIEGTRVRGTGRFWGGDSEYTQAYTGEETERAVRQ